MHVGYLSALLSLATAACAVWPAPRQFYQGTDVLKLSDDFSISFAASLEATASQDLREAVSDALSRLKNDGLAPLVPDRGRSLAEAVASAQALDDLEIRLSQKPVAWIASSLRSLAGKDAGAEALSIAQEANKPLADRDESYALYVPPASASPKRSATLSAPNALGLLRGLQTFTQLVYSVPGEAGAEAEFRYLHAPVRVKDAPAYPHRGILIDTSRNFFSVESLKRTVDAMSWAKLNTLHWHAVDAQSFPLFVPSHPELVAKTAYSPRSIYSQSDIRDLVAYAGARGVAIMPEIDTPGHTAVLGEVVPDLIACREKTPWWEYAAEPPAGQLRIADPDAARFVSDVFSSLAGEFPGPLFSSGGDEVVTKCYDEDEPTQVQLVRRNLTLEEALSEFVATTHDALREKGKTPVVWEELALHHQVDLKKDVIVTVWKSSENARAVADKGFRILQGPSDFAYLDCGAGGWLGNSVSGTSWCDPFKTWQKIYSFDPVANLTNAQRKLVIGGQTLLWTEQADEQNLDSLLWPRSLAAAEVYWTGAKGPNGPRSVSEALPRIHDMRYRMVNRGIRAVPLQPHWCALRPGACDAPSS